MLFLLLLLVPVYASWGNCNHRQLTSQLLCRV